MLHTFSADVGRRDAGSSGLFNSADVIRAIGLVCCTNRLAPGTMHCNLLWIVEALVAAQKGHFRVRHFAGVFIIPLLSTRFLCV